MPSFSCSWRMIRRGQSCSPGPCLNYAKVLEHELRVPDLAAASCSQVKAFNSAFSPPRCNFKELRLGAWSMHKILPENKTSVISRVEHWWQYCSGVFPSPPMLMLPAFEFAECSLFSRCKHILLRHRNTSERPIFNVEEGNKENVQRIRKYERCSYRKYRYLL